MFVSKGGKYFRIVPIDGAIVTMTRVFGDTRDIFISFAGGCVSSVLTHACAEIDARLADVNGFRITVTRLKIDSFFVERIGMSFVVFAENIC